MRKYSTEIFLLFRRIKISEKLSKTVRKLAERTNGTWLSDELMERFISFMNMDWQKVLKSGKMKNWSVVLWFQIGNVFCGESMFSKVSNASKAGFIHFAETIKT
jgi:leucyl/phenylalanyl-tRNA--protein transferase